MFASFIKGAKRTMSSSKVRLIIFKFCFPTMFNKVLNDTVLSPERAYFCRRDFRLLHGRIAGNRERKRFGAETLKRLMFRLATLFVFAPSFSDHLDPGRSGFIDRRTTANSVL